MKNTAIAVTFLSEVHHTNIVQTSAIAGNDGNDDEGSKRGISCGTSQGVCSIDCKSLDVVSRHQEYGLCAISGLPLQFHGAEDDKAMLCSLDRIDSSKHYEYGNLQVVCQFLNMWKGARENAEFCRLIDILQQGSPLAQT